MTVLGGICEIVGVVLFMVGFFYCAKEALVWSYQSYQRKKQQKQREKKDSNCAIKRVEVLPVDAKPKQLQRQKSETTKLFEQQFEASTIANTFLDDEKRKSSARLKQRRESRLRGTKPPTNKPVKRGRSTTTQIFLENQAGASILNTRVESDRKVSANRLANRLKERKQRAGGGGGHVQNDGNLELI